MAQQYVEAFASLAKTTNTLILPASAGDVAGMVFAASVSDQDTGYALTASQVSESAALGVTRASPVDTGTVMDDNTEVVERLCEPFCDRLALDTTTAWATWLPRASSA